MNKEEKQHRFEELEEKAKNNFIKSQMEIIGFYDLIADYLDKDEQKEYHQLEKELYS